MRALKKLMSTQLPGPVILPRLFVALVLLVDALRGWGVHALLGDSALEHVRPASRVR